MAGHRCPTSRRRGFRGLRGFTIVELLVVISIISLLMAILLPALGKARAMARRSLCQANERNWGQALRAYAADNNRAFPYNGPAIPGVVPVGGQHCSWNSSVVQQFWADYLIANSQTSKTDEDDVLNCPTQKWHQVNDPTLAGGLIGYFYLPHRDPNNINYTPAGRGWVAKRRFDGPFAKAPIMMDMKQWHPTRSWWWNSDIPFSSHVNQSHGEPDGSFFLFEDGHVAWYPNDEIDVGADLGWKCYYKIPIN